MRNEPSFSRLFLDKGRGDGPRSSARPGRSILDSPHRSAVAEFAGLFLENALRSIGNLAVGPGLPIRAELAGGETSDYVGFDVAMSASGPAAKVIITGRGYDSDKIRNSTQTRCTATVISM